MLLDNTYTLINQLKFNLLFDNNVKKLIVVKVDDIIKCYYRENNKKHCIVGRVSKIGCEFNSTLGRTGSSVYMKIDGSEEYCGQVVYIKPDHVLDLSIIETTNVVSNPVCTVETDDQKITLIRENELGTFQYSKDGIIWNDIGVSPGLSAYECALQLGFIGSEEDWLNSLVGPRGPKGDPADVKISAVYSSAIEAEMQSDEIEDGKIIAIVGDPTILYVRNRSASGNGSSCTCGCATNRSVSTSKSSAKRNTEIKGYIYLGLASVGIDGKDGAPGKDGIDGKSAYEYAVEVGFKGTEEEFAERLLNEFDNVLSLTSTNAVQNKVVTKKLDELEKELKENSFITKNEKEGNSLVLENCLDKHFSYLNVYGSTDESFNSFELTGISIYNADRTAHQDVTFNTPIVLRAVPTDNPSCETITIDGERYAADFIGTHDGKVGIFRKVDYIESYAGECILSDFITSTGTLDIGSQVQYVTHVRFEELDEITTTLLEQLHTYEGTTIIEINGNPFVRAEYRVNFNEYIKTIVDNIVMGDTLTEVTNNVTEVTNSYIDKRIGDIDIEQTIKEYIDTHITEGLVDLDLLEQMINKVMVRRLGNVPEDMTVKEYIDSIQGGKVVDFDSGENNSLNQSNIIF